MPATIQTKKEPELGASTDRTDADALLDPLKSSALSDALTGADLTGAQPIQRVAGPSTGGGSGGNSGLPGGLQSNLEAASGMDMSDVRVHSNSSEPGRVGAHAFTQGTDIHMAPGQSQHLPHEAWHVVQQKQGRVAPGTTQAKGGATINEDAGLEAEADRMGALVANGNVTSAAQELPKTGPAGGGSLQRKVIQRAKVQTDTGEFETTTFEETEGSGVKIVLKFHPDGSHINATKIGLAQSVAASQDGEFGAIDPAKAGRMVSTEGESQGYTHDRVSRSNNPIYGAADLGSGETLADTAQDNNRRSAETNVGVNATYELGHAYTPDTEGAEAQVKSAGLYDAPKGSKKKGRKKVFESTALGLEGADAGKYFGSVFWGYEMKGTTAAPTVSTEDITLASKGDPTARFTDSAALWNASTTQGTVQVTADPATVYLYSDGSSGTLAKDTKLKQLKTISWQGSSALKAEVLDGSGNGSGKIVRVKVADCKDAGDGGATTNLPIPG